jgi:hypothetical protein
MVGHDEDLDALFPGGQHDSPQILEQADLLSDWLHPRSQLSAFRQKVVVGVHE